MPPMINPATLLSFAMTVAKVAAHGYVQGIDVDGTYYSGYIVTQFPHQSNPPSVIGWTESATDLGFIAPDAYSSADIICDKSAKNAKLSAKVSAGGTIRMDWTTWPDSHHGPIINYLARCSNGDCTTVDKSNLEFFKISQAGLINDGSEPGTWGSDQLIANNNSWSTTIPSTITPGPYVLRHEIIALHSAGNSDGAQNYPQCINLIVTGSGTYSPTKTRGEALYTETDPGILVNIYTTGLTYIVPGPTLYNSGASATTAPAIATSAQVVTSSLTTLVTSIKPASTTIAQAAASTSASIDDDACEL